MVMEVRFEDVDGDGDREVVVENRWLSAVLRFPETLGYAFYKGRFTWGGRLQSLEYKPTGRAFVLPKMIDMEGINPFGLPDELFANFPFIAAGGGQRNLKMGVGVFSEQGGEAGFESLPWTWRSEADEGGEKVVAFRQEVEDLGGYSYVYEKRYRFRPDAAWFALDVVLENRGDELLASAWDVHTFHPAGVPPNTAWLVAPKRAWLSCGQSRMRTFVKEASPIFATPIQEEMVSDRILWDMDGTPWWYATGPADGDEFYLMRARFDADWGMFWAGYGAFTPQAINNVEVPPGERAVWGFDVTMGSGGKNFVAAGEDCGLSLDREGEKVVVSLHAAAPCAGDLAVEAVDESGGTNCQTLQGEAAPGCPLRLEGDLPAEGEYAELDLHYRGESGALSTREIVPLRTARPSAHLPFGGDGMPVFVAVEHELQKPEADGRYLWCHATQAGFAADWVEPGVRAPDDLGEFKALCLVGDAWPMGRLDELRTWVERGGGLLVCAPFGELAHALGDWLPLRPLADVPEQPDHAAISGAGMRRYAESGWRVEGDGEEDGRHIWRMLHTQTLERVDPVVGLHLGARHETSERLMLEPDAKVRIGYWVACRAHPEAIVTLRFTDEGGHPAVALRQLGEGRVAAVASRPAWGTNYRKVVWDGWGQYHRAFWAGLMGWVARCW